MLLAAVLMLIATVPLVQAQNFQVLHTFTGSDGAQPKAVSIDQAGNLFGVTEQGGPTDCVYQNQEAGCGTVFELRNNNSQLTFSSIFQFTGYSTGWFPDGSLTIGPGDILYGVTQNFTGFEWAPWIFRLRPTCGDVRCNNIVWLENTIYTFYGMTTANGGLVLDQAGNLYGTTIITPNGVNGGLTYELSPAQNLNGWRETDLHRFSGSDGQWPEGPVIFDGAGNLYGSTNAGGRGPDVVYELTPSGTAWSEMTLHNFSGPDGAYPVGNLVFDNNGNLYGITSKSGVFGRGTVFELSPSPNGWTFTSIFSFEQAQGSPLTGLVVDSVGNLYGSAQGGRYASGLIYELSPTNNGWTYTDLHDFTGGRDGNLGPVDGPRALDANGNLYGVTAYGGDPDCGCGTVWTLSLSQRAQTK
jgi:hypothetical protein